MNLGARVHRAREALGLSQDQLAEQVGLRREAISEIENGKRNVKVDELIRLAQALGRPLEFFVSEEEPLEPVVAYRGDALSESGVPQAKVRLESRIGYFEELVQRLGWNPSCALAQTRTTARGVVALAVRAALEQRKLLGLGACAVRSMRTELESKLQVPVFAESLGRESVFCGMLLFGGKHNTPGMLLNADLPQGRRNFTLAHEWGHLVWKASSSEFTADVLDTLAADRDSAEEKFANAFAAHLLAPEEAILHQMEDKELKGRDLDAEAIQRIAYEFGVSFQVMTYRLQDCGLLGREAAKALRENTRVTGLQYYSEELEPMQKMSPLYEAAVMEGYHDHDLHPSKAAEMLSLTTAEFMERADAAEPDFAAEQALAATG